MGELWRVFKVEWNRGIPEVERKHRDFDKGLMVVHDAIMTVMFLLGWVAVTLGIFELSYEVGTIWAGVSAMILAWWFLNAG